MADTDTLEDRVPCTDEMCVGIIGPSGRCGVCGKPGTPPQSGRIEHPHDDLHSTPDAGSDTEPDPDAEADRRAASPSSEPEAEDDSEAEGIADRIPCPDEMCVGILSPKGRCGTCGKQWPPP